MFSTRRRFFLAGEIRLCDRNWFGFNARILRSLSVSPCRMQLDKLKTSIRLRLECCFSPNFNPISQDEKNLRPVCFFIAGAWSSALSTTHTLFLINPVKPKDLDPSKRVLFFEAETEATMAEEKEDTFALLSRPGTRSLAALTSPVLTQIHGRLPPIANCGLLWRQVSGSVLMSY